MDGPRIAYIGSQCSSVFRPYQITAHQDPLLNGSLQMQTPGVPSCVAPRDAASEG